MSTPPADPPAIATRLFPESDPGDSIDGGGAACFLNCVVQDIVSRLKITGVPRRSLFFSLNDPLE